MNYTERDLEIARQNVVILERFIRQHRAITNLPTWDAEEREQAEQLFSQFENSLREAKSRYDEMWSDLHPLRAGER